MTLTIVGCDARPATADAVALAALLDPDSQSRLLVATAVPPRLLAGLDDEQAQRAGDAVLTAAAARLGGDAAVERRALDGRSPAHALLWLAENEHADLLVVGSSRDARTGEVRAGDVGRGLLSWSPCPVAIAPAAFALDRVGDLRRVGIAWCEGAEALEAVRFAEGLPLRAGAERRLLSVVDFDLSRALWGYEAWASLLAIEPSHLRDEARAVLEAAEREHDLPGTLLEGDPAHELIEASRDLDLLVIGSRGHGPLRRAALGSVSTRVVHGAHCAVVIVPRGDGRLAGDVPGSAS